MTVGEGQLVSFINILARFVVQIAEATTPDINQVDPDPNLDYKKYLKPTKLTQENNIVMDELNGITKWFEKCVVRLNGVEVETSNFGAFFSFNKKYCKIVMNINFRTPPSPLLGDQQILYDQRV